MTEPIDNLKSGHGFSEGGEIPEDYYLKPIEPDMDQATKERIEKEAIEYAQKIGDKTRDFHDGINAKYAYIDGATSEATVWAEKLKHLETQSHDQVRIIEHLEKELAKERELRKELVDTLKSVHKGTTFMHDDIELILQKAKE